MRSGQVYVAASTIPTATTRARTAHRARQELVDQRADHARDELWGELWATTDQTRTEFSDDDVELLQEVTERVQPAIAQAELLAACPATPTRTTSPGWSTAAPSRSASSGSSAGRSPTARHHARDGGRRRPQAGQRRGGHDAGDRLLKKVGVALRGCLGDFSDAVACRTAATSSACCSTARPWRGHSGDRGGGPPARSRGHRLSYGVAASDSGELTRASCSRRPTRAVPREARPRPAAHRPQLPRRRTARGARHPARGAGHPLHGSAARRAAAPGLRARGVRPQRARVVAHSRDRHPARRTARAAVDRVLSVTLSVADSHFAARFELRFEPVDAPRSARWSAGRCSRRRTTAEPRRSRGHARLGAADR
jgi:hypothetical protein